MDMNEIIARSKEFAILCAQLIMSLPYNTVNKNYGSQLIRSSSSVGANYRASRRAKSNPDFINKLKIVEEELDESLFFLELLQEFNHDKFERISNIYPIGEELLRIVVSSLKTLRQNKI